jgi:DNA-binding response OmpR family regulator
MAVDPDSDGRIFHVLQETMRILFVDGDPILREFAVVNLTSQHVTVETAPDGAAALAQIEAAAPDIVLLDLEMPTVDGFEALRRLRADPSLRDLPVVVVTGREDIDAVARAFEAGAASFVVKPLNWRLLGHQLRYVRRGAAKDRAAAEDRAQGRLARLAAEGAQFISQALTRDPGLRPAAVAFARAANAALEDAARDAADPPAETHRAA